jgi:hypothetical protein
VYISFVPLILLWLNLSPIAMTSVAYFHIFALVYDLCMTVQLYVALLPPLKGIGTTIQQAASHVQESNSIYVMGLPVDISKEELGNWDDTVRVGGMKEKRVICCFGLTHVRNILLQTSYSRHRELSSG